MSEAGPAPSHGAPGKWPKINLTAILAAIAAVITTATLVLGAVHGLLGQVEQLHNQLRDHPPATVQDVQAVKAQAEANSAQIRAGVDALQVQVAKAPTVVTDKTTTTVIRETTAPAPKVAAVKPAGKPAAVAVRPTPTFSPTPTPAPGLLGFLLPPGKDHR